MKKIFTSTLALSLIISLLCCLPVSAAESYTDAKSWTIKASSDGMGGIAGAFDNNEKSYWHTSYTVENGQIAVVLIDDEATLKRVYFDKDNKRMILNPANPAYAPIVVDSAQLESGSVRILGKAVMCQFRIN